MEPGAPEKRIIKYTVRRKMTIRQVIKKIMIRLRLKKEQIQTKEEQWCARDVTIDNRVIVGAGTVISKDIPDNVVVVQGCNSAYRVLCTFDEYIAKQKKRMEKFPVSDILFANRTDEQWEEWKMELNRASSGFDL